MKRLRSLYQVAGALRYDEFCIKCVIDRETVFTPAKAVNKKLSRPLKNKTRSTKPH